MKKNVRSFKLFLIIFLAKIYIYSSLDLKMLFKVFELLRQLFRVKIIYVKIYYFSVGSDFLNVLSSMPSFIIYPAINTAVINTFKKLSKASVSSIFD